MTLEVVERVLRLTCSWTVGQGRVGRVLGLRVMPSSFAFTFVLPLLCLGAGMHHSVMDRVDLFTDAVATSVCFVKMRCLQRHTATLIEVRRLLRDEFIPLEAPLQGAAADANARCERRASRLSLGYVLTYSSLSVTGMAIMGLSVLSGDPADRKLTTKAPAAFLREDYLFWPCFLGISMELYLVPLVTGIYDALFLTLCLHIACKCDNLWLLMRQANPEQENLESVQNRKTKISEAGNVDKSLRLRSQEDCLRDGVRYHQLIIRLHQMTEGMFSGVTLYQTIYILFGVGIPLIRISNGSLGSDPNKIMFALTYASWNICQLLTFCWFGDKVARMSSNVAGAPFAAFEGLGDGDLSSVGPYLQLMTLRAQKPLYLTAGRFTNLTLRLCLDIMKRSYSLYSALFRMR